MSAFAAPHPKEKKIRAQNNERHFVCRQRVSPLPRHHAAAGAAARRSVACLLLCRPRPRHGSPQQRPAGPLGYHVDTHVLLQGQEILGQARISFGRAVESVASIAGKTKTTTTRSAALSEPKSFAQPAPTRTSAARAKQLGIHAHRP
jgi:hypothetical protein